MFVGCLTSQKHASLSQGRICSDNFTCCHTEIEVADQTFHLTQSQYANTGPTSPSTDPITPGAWQGRHWSANFYVTGMTRPWKNLGTSGIRTRDLPLSRWMPYNGGSDVAWFSNRSTDASFPTIVFPRFLPASVTSGLRRPIQSEGVRGSNDGRVKAVTSLFLHHLPDKLQHRPQVSRSSLY